MFQAELVCEGVSGEGGLGGLFITQTSVAVMTSPQTRLDPRLAASRSSVKCEAEEVSCSSSCPSSCPGMCQKSHTERVVVALLLGALIIIFLTLVLSLVYLRESSQHQQYSQTRIFTSERGGPVLDREERLVQWGAANNVKYFLNNQIFSDLVLPQIKIKPGSGASPAASQLEGTCQLPQCWSLGRRVMLMADQTAEPCHSFYSAACGGWLANISQQEGGRGRGREPGLENFSVMDETKADIDRKIKGNI